MNNEIWDILTKELAIYGIKLINAGSCEVYHDNDFTQMPTNNAMSSIHKRVSYNGKILESVIQETINLLGTQQTFGIRSPLDALSLNYFVNTLKDMYDLSLFLKNNFIFNDQELKSQFCNTIRQVLNKDYTEITKETILLLPSYKISLDWIFRKIELLAYIRSLLEFARMGPTRISQLNIKVARGISGPWSNLDLPLLERKYPWADIAEEMAGRDRDKKMQRRYRKGFEVYNDPYGRVGEGHYWREIRNEPYMWTDRKTESPYPSRNMLST